MAEQVREISGAPTAVAPAVNISSQRHSSDDGFRRTPLVWIGCGKVRFFSSNSGRSDVQPWDPVTGPDVRFGKQATTRQHHKAKQIIGAWVRWGRVGWRAHGLRAVSVDWLPSRGNYERHRRLFRGIDFASIGASRSSRPAFHPHWPSPAVSRREFFDSARRPTADIGTHRPALPAWDVGEKESGRLPAAPRCSDPRVAA